MTPAARLNAAIEVLDTIQAGTVAEKALTAWARGNRFAGSKDRAAIRDHVYEVLRAKRSLAHLGGGTTGRALILGLLRRENIAPEAVFGAGGYGPEALSDAELQAGLDPQTMTDAVACDIPDWLWPMWQASLGGQAAACAKVQQSRAPVCLRVNKRRSDRAGAIARLAEDGIVAVPHPDVKTALEVVENERRVHQSAAYIEGLVELQDAASQAAMLTLNIAPGATVLDYCAGGGGKALALADLYDAQVTAHDINAGRMADIPVRAARAGVDVATADRQGLDAMAPFDVVLCDAPCSGSGTWRRTPDAKWRLTAEKLLGYNDLQLDVLASGAGRVAPGGRLVYATCSVLDCENDAVVAAFCGMHPGWHVTKRLRLTPSPHNDGFFIVVLSSDQTTLD